MTYKIGTKIIWMQAVTMTISEGIITKTTTCSNSKGELLWVNGFTRMEDHIHSYGVLVKTPEAVEHLENFIKMITRHRAEKQEQVRQWNLLRQIEILGNLR